MVYFITALRALAACIITNSHYTGVYPLDFIANGGFIGNMIFCGVSGYCLCQIKQDFPRWYGKRLVRCYLPVWIITGLYFLLGFFAVEEQGLLSSFFYPTRYHFIGSIVLLYIPFYIVMRIKPFREHLAVVMAGVGGAVLVYYICFFDKSYYHVEEVRGLIYRTVLFLGMLMGALLRQKDASCRSKPCKWYLLLAPVLFVAYLGAGFVFNKKPGLCALQIVSPLLAVAALYCILWGFAGLDGFFEKLPAAVRRCIDFLAAMTLEIYLVQGELIERLRPLVGFPVNWAVLTAAILVAALGLHLVCEGIMKLTGLKRK